MTFEMTSEAEQNLRFFVSGRVQGVFFRAATQEYAQQLGITGYVRNLKDGRVEVYARGERAQLDALGAWLWRGPPNAKVSAVDTVPAEPPPAERLTPERFDIR
ncbi:MAG: acylphosphatase [Gammaproteobacteria bacterium]